MRWSVPEVCAETKTEHSEAEALFLFLGQRTNLELKLIYTHSLLFMRWRVPAIFVG
jgi:hypothetical protein